MSADQTDPTKRFQQGDADSTTEKPPVAAYITWLHSLAPYRSPRDLHHMIGTQDYDAAGGSHRHRGGDNSLALFDSGDVISGDISTTSGQREALADIIAMLASLGAQDSTTG